MRAEHKMTGDELDACTPWRHVHCYLQRPGVRKKVKRRSHRIDRRAARRAIAREVAAL